MKYDTKNNIITQIRMYRSLGSRVVNLHVTHTGYMPICEFSIYIYLSGSSGILILDKGS